MKNITALLAPLAVFCLALWATPAEATHVRARFAFGTYQSFRGGYGVQLAAPVYAPPVQFQQFSQYSQLQGAGCGINSFGQTVCPTPAPVAPFAAPYSFGGVSTYGAGSFHSGFRGFGGFHNQGLFIGRNVFGRPTIRFIR